MSKAPRVLGYKEISFWQEDGIGVITIFSDENGNVTPLFFEEFLKAISLAITDDKVKAIAITGSNENFLSGMRKHESLDLSTYLELTSSIATFLGTINKPVFSLVNGKCSNMGVELALLGDLIIARENAEFEISDSYLPSMGLTKTLQRFSFFVPGKPIENRNCDIVFPSETFLDESNTFILGHIHKYFVMLRQERLGEINHVLNFEHRALLLNKEVNLEHETNFKQSE